MKQLPVLPNIQKLLTELTDFVFPPSQEEMLLRGVTPHTLRLLYRPGLFKSVVYLSHYTEPVIRASITENKFHHNPLAAIHLQNLFRHWVSTQTKPTLYIPIPLGKERLRERGHNQVETFFISVVPKNDTGTNILRRRTETLPQSQLDKASREKNVENAFVFVGNSDTFTDYSQVVLVDDVLTTGATFKAARAELAPHLPSHVTLVCLALAH